MHHFLISEIEKKTAAVGRGRPRKMIAVVQPPTAVLVTYLSSSFFIFYISTV